MKVLQQVLELLHARLVIQTDEDCRAQTSIARAGEAIRAAIAQPQPPADPPLTRAVMQQMIAEELGPLRQEVRRLEGEVQAAASVAE